MHLYYRISQPGSYIDVFDVLMSVHVDMSCIALICEIISPSCSYTVPVDGEQNKIVKTQVHILITPTGDLMTFDFR